MRTVSCVQDTTRAASGGNRLVLVSTVELDTSIQCRADIDITTVNEYAEAMADGAKFPPVVLFGTEDKSWIADGWHRVMAARSLGLAEIAADLRPGGRIDALKAALAANAAHGRRRTPQDKRCAVAIALREFGKMSDRAIADMCAVSDKTVASVRQAIYPTAEFPQFSTRLSRDGKERPAHPAPPARPSTHEATSASHPEVASPSPNPGPPRDGMRLANAALGYLGAIRPNDLEREQAFQLVRRWLDEHDA